MDDKNAARLDFKGIQTEVSLQQSRARAGAIEGPLKAALHRYKNSLQSYRKIKERIKTEAKRKALPEAISQTKILKGKLSEIKKDLESSGQELLTLTAERRALGEKVGAALVLKEKMMSLSRDHKTSKALSMERKGMEEIEETKAAAQQKQAIGGTVGIESSDEKQGVLLQRREGRGCGEAPMMPRSPRSDLHGLLHGREERNPATFSTLAPVSGGDTRMGTQAQTSAERDSSGGYTSTRGGFSEQNDEQQRKTPGDYAERIDYLKTAAGIKGDSVELSYALSNGNSVSMQLLSVEGEQIRVRLNADNPVDRRRLRVERAGIEKALADAGIRVSDLSLGGKL